MLYDHIEEIMDRGCPIGGLWKIKECNVYGEGDFGSRKEESVT